MQKAAIEKILVDVRIPSVHMLHAPKNTHNRARFNTILTFEQLGGLNLSGKHPRETSPQGLGGVHQARFAQ
jgi:hypothetical protein